MKLSEVKNALKSMEELSFQLPDESFVPAHFHVTEVGRITRNFIDCGGKIRMEEKVNFQLWEDAKDIDHRLKSRKLIDIITLSERVLGLEDLEVEVEYQEYTIGKFGIEFDGHKFLLTNTYTDCLAKDSCGIPQNDTPISDETLVKKNVTSCCSGSGCC